MKVWKSLLLAALIPLLAFGATNDVLIQQRNAADTAYANKVVSPAANSLLGFGADKAVGDVTLGTGLALVGGVLSASGAPGEGTVTSVGVTTANGVSATGGPITSAGSFTFSLGNITPTTVNKVTITAPASGSTLTIANGKTLTVSNTLTLAGTDSTVQTFPTTTATIARTDSAQTFTGVQTFGTPIAFGSGGTGASSFTNHGVVTAGSSALATIAPGTSGNVLTSNGTDWTSAAATGAVTSVTGTANEITASPTTGAVIVSLPTALTFTGKTVTNGSFAGIQTFSGTYILAASAMGALAIDVTKQFNTKTISVDSTFTFSGTPGTTNQVFAMFVTNSDSADHTLTIPSSVSLGRSATITTVIIPASGYLYLKWVYIGSTYFVSGDPAATSGTGSFALTNGATFVAPVLGTPTSGVATNLTGLPLTTGVTGILPVANGGTGTASPGLVQGTNVTITGSWPNQTIAAAGGGGGSPGGSNTQVQYNNSSAFGGAAGFTFDGTAKVSLGVNTTTLGQLKLFGNTSGDATIQSAAVAGTATVLTLPATTDTLVGKATTDTLTNKTLTSPVINGATSSGSTAIDFSGNSGTFNSSTGTNTLGGTTTINGALTINDSSAPNIVLASGKTSTGIIRINGKTSGNFKITVADTAVGSGTLNLAAQPSGNTTVSIPDMAGASDTFVFLGKAQTFSATQTFGAIQPTTIELGNASDTTFARVSGGVASIEGSNIMTVGGTDTITGVKTFSTAAVLGSSTATTQTAGDASTKVSTTAYADRDSQLQYNAQTGTTYTLALTDGTPGSTTAGVSLSNAAAVTLTVPTNASIAFPTGWTIPILSLGAGAVTITPAGGVTINSPGGLLTIGTQYGTAVLNKTGTNTWQLYGLGSLPSVVSSSRLTGQTASASLTAFTVGANDSSFEVSANVLVTTSTVHSFTATCTYTDEGNTSRTLTMTFSNVGGTLVTAIANAGGTVPYEGVPLHIRAKAATTVTFATTGTFTTVTYNFEDVITQTR